jgi:hypothetical protein
MLVCSLNLVPMHLLTRGADFWDVKFYPYSDVGDTPIFVVVGSQMVSSPILLYTVYSS